jgi:thiosulfate sulfurtransferase
MPDFSHISIADTAAKISNDEVTVCDIRDPHTFNAGHIPGAFHLTNHSMTALLKQLDFSRPLVVCCYHGHSSQSAAQYLAKEGFKQVYSMDGGFAEWAKTQPVAST